MRRVISRRAVLRAVALAGAAVLAPRRARAHAVLVRSSPARRATLGQPPRRVELTFNERLEPAYSSVSVWSARGDQVDARDVMVGPPDPRQLSVGLPELAPGTYTVRFRVLSVDGHVVESSFPFTVR
jgi:copper resistance protein C